MALVEGCRHEFEISIPVAVVEEETAKVVKSLREKARMPGFRPGKVPESMVRKHLAGDVRQKVLENLVPKYFRAKTEEESLRVVSAPDYSDIHFHDGEPVRLKASFEVFPEIALADYTGVEVEYAAPEVTDEDVAKRLEELRESKATYVNEDPRPLADNDFAVITLESISGAEPPIKSDEVVVQIGGSETLPGFSESLRGASPEEEKEYDVIYPSEYGSEKLAGKTVRFRSRIKGIRRKELPAIDDNFAQDLGDYRTADELKTAVRASIYSMRENEAQRQAKDKIVEKLAAASTFPVPKVFVDRQIEHRVQSRLQSLQQQGVDPRSFNLDWEKVRAAQHDAALGEVKSSLVVQRVSELEKIGVTNDEVDKELERIAAQNREPIASMRKKLTEDGTLDRIASHIQTEKTLNFLFEKASKVAPKPAAE